MGTIKAARVRATINCGDCGKTGQFVTGMVNGKLVGPGGQCFRCQGKGYQTDADQRRNWGYDNYYRRVGV